MSWMSQAALASILANVTALESNYQAVKPGLITALGPQFSAQPDVNLRFIFCAFTAFDLKPYAQSSSTSFIDLIRDDALDCDNYVRLAWFFHQIMCPQAGDEICAVGWEGGPIGNHAQLQIKTPNAPYLTVDPTIGLAVNGMDLDSLGMGFKPPANCLYSIFGYQSRPTLVSFNSTVQAAILNGTYRTSHLLYAVNSIDRLNLVDREALGTYPVRNG